MNEETFKNTCMKIYPNVEFTTSPLGTIRANINKNGHKWRVAIFMDLTPYRSKWQTYPAPGLNKAARLYAALRESRTKNFKNKMDPRGPFLLYLKHSS